MDNTYLIITTILILVIVTAILWVIIRKIIKGNIVIKLNESDIVWKELKCPQCQELMETGFSLAGRGIIWREKNEKKPGLFVTIGSVLDNTLSLNAPPALNISWRCNNCKLVMLDNSKMIKIKKA